MKKDFELFKNENLGKVYTIQEIADKLGYSRNRINELLKELKINSILLKNRRLIPEKELIKFFQYFKKGVDTVENKSTLSTLRKKLLQSATLKELKTIYTKEELKQRIDFVVGFTPKSKQPEPLIQNNIKSITDKRETITPAQQLKIRNLINDKVNKTNCTHKHNYYYKAIHNKYNISKFDQLKQVDFEYAIRYIENMR